MVTVSDELIDMITGDIERKNAVIDVLIVIMSEVSKSDSDIVTLSPYVRRKSRFKRANWYYGLSGVIDIGVIKQIDKGSPYEYKVNRDMLFNC